MKTEVKTKVKTEEEMDDIIEKRLWEDIAFQDSSSKIDPPPNFLKVEESQYKVIKEKKKPNIKKAEKQFWKNLLRNEKKEELKERRRLKAEEKYRNKMKKFKWDGMDKKTFNKKTPTSAFHYKYLFKNKTDISNYSKISYRHDGRQYFIKTKRSLSMIFDKKESERVATQLITQHIAKRAEKKSRPKLVTLQYIETSDEEKNSERLRDIKNAMEKNKCEFYNVVTHNGFVLLNQACIDLMHSHDGPLKTMIEFMQAEENKTIELASVSTPDLCFIILCLRNNWIDEMHKVLKTILVDEDNKFENLFTSLYRHVKAYYLQSKNTQHPAVLKNISRPFDALDNITKLLRMPYKFNKKTLGLYKIFGFTAFAALTEYKPDKIPCIHVSINLSRSRFAAISSVKEFTLELIFENAPINNFDVDTMRHRGKRVPSMRLSDDKSAIVVFVWFEEPAMDHTIPYYNVILDKYGFVAENIESLVNGVHVIAPKRMGDAIYAYKKHVKNLEKHGFILTT